MCCLPTPSISYFIIQSAIAQAYVYIRVTRTHDKINARKYAYMWIKCMYNTTLGYSSDFLSEGIS